MSTHQIQLLFVDLALIVLLARGLGAVASRLRQPPVVGEILAGILLGPTLFSGWIANTLFPADVRTLLNGLAGVGVALFMFLVGLEIDRGVLSGHRRVTGGAVVGSVLVPFVLGIGLGLLLLRGHPTPHEARFVLFIGLSVSITAFPVLARILTDRGLSRTSLGGIALATAAVVDVVAWTALAGLQMSAGGSGEDWRVVLLVPFVLLLALVVRPVLRRLLTPGGTEATLTTGRLLAVLTGALLSGAATEAMGLHYIFGAFLFGLVLPRAGAARLNAEIHERTGHITSMLLPVYFVVAGLKVDLNGIGPDGLAEFAAILLVATVGKFGGTFLGARTQGLPGRESCALAALMNTRGLTELIILGVGLQLGLLDSGLYSLMVLMALVTTAMTGPLLSLIRPETLDPRLTGAQEHRLSPTKK